MKIGFSASATSTQIYQQLDDHGFKTWFRTKLPFRLTWGVHNMLAQNVPDPSVETDLSDAIFNAVSACKDDEGGVCGMKVYCGREDSGKTVSANLAIRRARTVTAIGGVAHSYPAVYVDAKGDLVKATKKVLEAPRDMDEDDMIESLFHHLSSRNQVNSLPSSIFGFDFDFGCFGGGRTGSQDTDDGAYPNTPGNLPPIIILDNVRTLLPDTLNMLEQIYQNVRKHRVLAVVITDKVEVANYVVAMNGARVEPLENRFQLQAGLTSYERVQSPNYPIPGTIGERTARGVVWQDEEWPRSKQHEYLVKFTEYANMAKDRSHVSDSDGYFSFLVPGENPEQASVQARQYRRRNNI